MKRIRTILIILYLSATGLLHAHVELIYPQGGETLAPGDVITIEWNELVMHNTLNWDLYYSTDEGMTWDVIEEDIDYGNLTYDWTVPSDSTNQARVMIIQDNEGTDYSDQSDDFTIAPTTGIDDNQSNTIILYPNPAASDFKVESSELIENIRIFDREGRLILQYKPGKRKAGISLGLIPDGIYVVKVKTAQWVIRRKLLVR